MFVSNSQPTHSIENSTNYIAQLNHEALEHRAIKHPFLNRLANGDFQEPSAVLRDFSFQYLAYSQDFLRYLTATISKLESRTHRDWLVENLIEESGHIDEGEAKALEAIGIKLEWVRGIPHPLLFTRFLDSIGYDKRYREQNDFCDEAKIWSHMFLNACSAGNAAQSLGAMGLGTENIVKHIYQPILKAINNFLTVNAKDRVFFDLHALLDDEHGDIINNIAIEYARYERHREMIREGMLMALNLRAGFFDAMLVRAEAIGKNQWEAKAG